VKDDGGLPAMGHHAGTREMTRVLGALLLLVTSCGGLAPEFTKEWNGFATVAPSLGEPFSYPAQLKLTVTGNEATLDQVCPAGGASLTATGTGDNASWSGSLVCDGFIASGCTSVVLTYASVRAFLSPDRSTLTVDGTGTMDLCGLTMSFTDSFVGK